MVDVTYDCVISDVQMPGMDGFQLLSWLREHRPQSRVIMMTAFGSPSARQEAFRNGVVAFLEKPFDLTALKYELRRALDSTAQPVATVDLLELTQVISLSRRDVAVQAQVGDQVGLLVFERGELISATLGALHGEEAFFAMCAAPAQQATPCAAPERVERNLNQPVSALIFDALLKRDTALASAPASLPEPSAPPATAAPLRSQPSPFLSRAPTTGPRSIAPGQLSGLHQMPVRDPQATLSALVAAIARPCAAALVMPDGKIRAQAQTRIPPEPEAVFNLLIQGFVAFARAAQAGQWGAPRSARLVAAGEQALVRIVGPRPNAPALVVVAPADIELRQLEAAIAVHEVELIERTL
jgi:CheY-like chemotaxis protein